MLPPVVNLFTKKEQEKSHFKAIKHQDNAVCFSETFRNHSEFW